MRGPRQGHRKPIDLAAALAQLPAIHAAALVRQRSNATQEPVTARLAQQLGEMVSRWERQLERDQADTECAGTPPR